MRLDIQQFTGAGDYTWHKPDGAVRVDVVVQAAGAGGSVAIGKIGDAGGDGELQLKSFPAGQVPDEVRIEIGRGGRGAQIGNKAGDGADGYAVVITSLSD